MSLKSIAVVVSDYVLSKFGKSVLQGLGLGVFSAAVVLTLFQQLITYAQSNFSQLGSDVLQILALGKVDYGLSIIVGACVLKVKLMISKVTIGKLK